MLVVAAESFTRVCKRKAWHCGEQHSEPNIDNVAMNESAVAHLQALDPLWSRGCQTMLHQTAAAHLWSFRKARLAYLVCSIIPSSTSNEGLRKTIQYSSSCTRRQMSVIKVIAPHEIKRRQHLSQLCGRAIRFQSIDRIRNHLHVFNYISTLRINAVE